MVGFGDDGLDLEIGCESQEGSRGFSRVINSSCPPLSRQSSHLTNVWFNSQQHKNPVIFYFVFPHSNRHGS